MGPLYSGSLPCDRLIFPQVHLPVIVPVFMPIGDFLAARVQRFLDVALRDLEGLLELPLCRPAVEVEESNNLLLFFLLVTIQLIIKLNRY